MKLEKRIIQGIFVDHHDRTRVILHIAKSGIVLDKSGTQQTLSDAWELMNWEDLFDHPGHMMITEIRLTKKTIADEEGTALLLPRVVIEKSLDFERRRFCVLSSNVEAHGHIGSCPGYALLTSHGKATKPRKDELRKRVRTIIERSLTGEARMDTYKDRITETERVRERNRARVERGEVNVPMKPGNR